MRALGHRLKEKARNFRRERSPAPGSQPDEEAAGLEADDSELDRQTTHQQPRQDLWHQAFAMLSQKQKESLSVLANRGKTGIHAGDDISSIVPGLISATRARQEECETRSWRINLTGKPGNEIILRDQAAQIIAWLTKAGDVGVTFAPTLVNQIWPCVKAILQIPVSESDQMAALLLVADKVARVTARGRLYEACYTAANTPTGALETLHKALVALYKACLELLSQAAGLLSKNMLQRTVHSILYPDAVKNQAGSDFADLERRLALDVQAVESARSAGIDGRVARILQKVDADEELAILEWVSSVPYAGLHEAIVEDRMPNTCEWLLRHSGFRQWEGSSESAMMWLQGSTGTGKTFLTSKVIDHKIAILDSGPKDEGLAFFYFSRNDSARNSALSCLQSLVRQLSTSRRRTGYMRPALQELGSECRRNGRILNRELCRTQLADACNLFPRSTLIIDALDECSQDDREGLINVFDDLMQISGNPLMIFISGRPDGDIRAALRNRVCVQVGVDDNQDDISNFVKEKIQQHRRWGNFSEALKTKILDTLLDKSHGMFRWTELQIQELLKILLPEDVNDRLGKLPEGLKATYDEMYLKQIESRTKSESALAKRAIMWVLAAERPLRSNQLLSFVRIDPVKYIGTVLEPKRHTVVTTQENPTWLTSKVDEDMLLELCANLLTIARPGNYWQFCHRSVSEYFEDYHFSLIHADAHVGFVSQVLMIDLSRSVEAGQLVGAAKIHDDGDGNDSDESELFSQREWSYPEDYACLYWGIHVASVDESLCSKPDASRGGHGGLAEKHTDVLVPVHDLAALLQDFLGHPNESSAAYRFWHSKFITATPNLLAKRNSDKLIHGSEDYASFAMARFGLFNLLPTWWQTLQTSNERDTREDNTKGRFMIDTTVRSSTNWSLLDYASYFGHPCIVETLLAAGMDVDERDSVSGISRPLSLAVDGGHGEVCQVLIQCGGCDPNLPTDEGNPLYRAVQRNDAALIRCLLLAGADPNRSINLADTSPEPHVSPLSVAASHNRVNVLRILIEEDQTDLEVTPSKEYFRSSAAISAAQNYALDCLKYLVRDVHVDPNAEIRTGCFGSVLRAAFTNPFRRLDANDLGCLGDLGLDFNARVPWRYGESAHGPCADGSALEYAISRRDFEAVKLLVERYGADPNYLSEDGPWGCALAAAVNPPLPYWDILRYLVEERSANVNLQIPHGHYHSPLAAAAVLSDTNTIKYLIEKGAKVDLALEHGNYGSALASAVATVVDKLESKLESAQCLIDHGANVNLPLTHGLHGSALMAAAAVGNEFAVQFLIDNGADVNRPENDGWAASLLMGKELCQKSPDTPLRS